MARGYPVIWSTIIAMPILGTGVWLYLRLPDELYHVPVAVFGSFVIVMGVYVQLITPQEPVLYDDEALITTRHPSHRVAAGMMASSVPFLVAAGFLLFRTLYPYIYPTVVFLVGLYYFTKGIKTYWSNTLTRFFVTDERVISNYRFLSLKRKEIPMSKIRGIEENKSVAETLVGLGNVRLASGGGGGSVRLVIRNIEESSTFADEIRNLVRQS